MSVQAAIHAQGPLEENRSIWLDFRLVSQTI